MTAERPVAGAYTSRPCPGCGRGVDFRIYACGPCWARLPAELQRPIGSAWARSDWAAHMAAKRAADAWFGRDAQQQTAIEL